MRRGTPLAREPFDEVCHLVLQFFKGLFHDLSGPLNEPLHSAIRQVLYETSQLRSANDVAGLPTKAHALHSAFEQDV